MLLKKENDKMKKPLINEKCFVAQGAQIIGDVEIGEDSSVFFGAVLRGDMAKIKIGKGTNIQDNCTVHNDMGVDCVIGNNVTVGHNAVLHSCIIGDNSLIGMGSVVLSGAKIGKNVIIGAGSLVTGKTEIPDGTLYLGSPAKFKRDLTENEIKSNKLNALEYINISKEYMKKDEDFPYEIKEISSLDEEQLEKVYSLASLCEEHDGSKLKLNKKMIEMRISGEINEFLCFDNEKLIGYLGLCEIIKGCGEIEATAMVHPAYRNKKVFSNLFFQAKEIVRSRKIEKLIMIGYDSCDDSQKVAQKYCLKADHNEYSMTLKKSDWKTCENYKLTFRRALNRDLKELVFLDMCGFNITQQEAESFYHDNPITECYIAEINDKPVGHVSIIRENEEFSVCGLVVSPLVRKKGFGKEILDYALDIGFSDGYTACYLEVDENNRIATKLYRNTGFKIADKYNYYSVEIE